MIIILLSLKEYSNTFFDNNEPSKRINPLATVVMQTAHQIPSTPIPIRTNRMASGIRI